MISYPRLKTGTRSRQVIDAFRGYNHNRRIGSGEFYEMENLTSDDYPVLSARGKRGVSPVRWEGKCLGMYYVPGVGLFHIQKFEGDGALLLLNLSGEDTALHYHWVSAEPKQFALIGKKLVVAPDMKWIDIEHFGTGSLAKTWEVFDGAVTVQLCDADGNLYENVTVDTEPPTTPGYHQLWLCNAAGNVGLSQYEPSSSEWVRIASTYLKISGLGNHNFNIGDGVEISGFSELYGFDGSYVIRDSDYGELIVPGSIKVGKYTQNCDEKPITIQRKVPKLDFMVEVGNRLWGCTRKTNEIYACKLGDIFNWNCFQELSTDSWVVSVGTPGEFTGAVVQNGYPIFYKENCKHKVWPSATGAHQVTSVHCDGVQKGCENSLAVFEGTVFYKSVFGIFADAGGGAVEIGQHLGNVPYQNATGAVYDRKYYLNMNDSEGNNHLFVYDIAKRMWHREDGIAGILISGGNSLYGVTDSDIWDLTGNTGTPEETVSWMTVTGDLGLELPEQKYISRLTLRLCLEPGATLEIYAQYDREQSWVKLGQVYGTDLRSFSLPVRPRRCDQLRLKLQGTGMCKIYSITKTLEKGSELA